VLVFTVTLSYVHQNSDMEPLHCICTKHRIGLVHNAPICLKLKSLAFKAWLLLNLAFVVGKL